MPKVRTATKADRIVREANERGVGPTPERLRRAGEAVEPANFDADKHTHYDTIRLMDGDGGLLDILAREKKLDTFEYASCLRLFRLYKIAGSDGAKALDWTRTVVDCQPSGDISDKRLDAIKETGRVEEKLGFETMHPFVWMILRDKHPQDYAKERWPLIGPRDARSMAIGALCMSARKIEEYFLGPRKGRILATGMADYRPKGLVPDTS